MDNFLSAAMRAQAMSFKQCSIRYHAVLRYHGVLRYHAVLRYYAVLRYHAVLCYHDGEHKGQVSHVMKRQNARDPNISFYGHQV